jgi:hypothetical protein
LNPFGATMSPDHGAPQPGPPQPGPPEAPHQPRWNDPAAFAATAPPPTSDEHAKARGVSPAPVQRSSEPAPEPRPSAPAEPRPSVPAAGPGVDPEQVAANAPRTIAGFLVTFEGNELGAFWPLYQGKNEIGRKGASDNLDIEIDHPTCSSRHAVILASARPARLKLEDPGSTNGTFLESGKIENGKKYELKDGQVVRFGAFSVIVKIV